LKSLRSKADEQKAALDQLTAASQQQAGRMTAIMVSTLPPRQKLELFRRGVIELKAEDARYLATVVRADDIRDSGMKASSALSAAANALQNIKGVKPDVVRALSDGSAVLQGATNLAAAWVAQDYFSVGMSAMSLVGSIAGFGKNKPDPTQLALTKLFVELRELGKKIDEYHEQEMQAIEAVNARVLELQSLLLSEIANLKLLVFDNYTITAALAEAELSKCGVLENDYWAAVGSLEHWSIDAFAEWMAPQRASDYFRPCSSSIATYLQPFGELRLSPIFTPLAQSDDANANAGAPALIESARATVQRLIRPTREYAEKYNLLDEERRRALRVPWSSLADVDGMSKVGVDKDVAPAPHPSAHVATRKGGHRMLDARRTVAISATFRTVLDWSGLMWNVANGDAQRGVTRAELNLCRSKPNECRLQNPRTEALPRLKQLRSVLQWLLEQEQLAAGLPVVADVANKLDKSILPAYKTARATRDERGEFQAKLTRPANKPDPGDPVRARSECATGNETRDVLCLMQANPYLADNAIAYLIWKRLENRGGRNAIAAYAAALEWSDADALKRLLGDDFHFYNTAPDMPEIRGVNRLRPQWAIELPRVFTTATKDYPSAQSPSAQSKIPRPPISCWSDSSQAVKGAAIDAASKDWDDALTIEGPSVAAQPEWSRCYALPSWRVVAAKSFSARPGFELAREELARLNRAIADLESPPLPAKN
jgi:hypothetical protein